MQNLTGGKFIVIEGPDGSGKREQQQKLLERLKNNKYKVTEVDFPQYEDSIFGELVGEILASKYGPIENIHPKIASVIYAADRWHAKQKIVDALAAGQIVVANRYTLSNMAHQSARLTKSQRAQFIKWLAKMEFGKNGFNIPKPDLYIVLDVPIEICRERIGKKLKRVYLDEGKPMDALEEDINNQTEAAAMYKKLSKTLSGMTLINCVPNGKQLTINQVHKLVWEAVSFMLK